MDFKSSNYRKFIATAATATLVATAVVPAAMANSSFTDVGDSYKESVDYLYANEIVQGLSDTQFGTDKNIKRVDVAVMIAKALLTDEEIDNAPVSSFTDVPERAIKHVNALKAKGFVNGKSDTRFAASDSITRGEAAIMLANAYEISGDIDGVTFTDVADRYKEAVAALVDNDITQGKKNNRFGTDDAITRGELAIFLHKLETLEEDKEFEVETVEAIATTINADPDAEQFLSFTVNGQEVSLEELAEAGYEVEFKSTTSGIFKDKATGELDMSKLSEGDTFKYQVVVTKDSNAIESKLATVKVENFDNIIVSLDKYELKIGDVKLEQNVIVQGEKVNVSGIKGTSKLGGEVSLADELTFESSDKTKLLVNKNGEITTVSAGDVKVIVKVEGTDASLEIPVTVATEARKADQVTTPKQEIGVVVGGELEIPLTVTDQYGEPFAGFTMDAFAVTDDEETIANVTVEAENAEKGLYKATVVATDKAGTSTLEIKFGEKTALSLPVTVDADKEVATRELELVDATADQTIDLNPLAEDETVQFVFNQYNEAGIFIAQEDRIGTESGDFKVSVDNENVAVTVDATGVITVSGVKAGTSVVTVKEGDIVRGEATVTVEDTTPAIKAVTFAGDKLETTPAQLDEILTVDGIELTSSKAVEIDYDNGEAILFLDVKGENATAEQYDEGTDILLGVVKVVSADIEAVSISAEGEIISGDNSLEIDDQGTVSLTITANDKTVAAQAINVNIQDEIQEENQDENQEENQDGEIA